MIVLKVSPAPMAASLAAGLFDTIYTAHIWFGGDSAFLRAMMIAIVLGDLLPGRHPEHWEWCRALS